MAGKPERTSAGGDRRNCFQHRHGATPSSCRSTPHPSPDELRNIFTFQVENDVFNRIGKSDRDYTNGVRFGWLSPRLPDLPDGLGSLTTFPTFFGEGPVSSVTRRFGISIGQNIYTPQDTDTSAPIHNDRPYAAWLYASFALQSTYKRVDPKTIKDEPVRLDTLQLDLGLIGPAAGGEFVQNNFHSLIGVATGQRLGQPAAQRADDRAHLRAALAHRPRRGLRDPKLEYDVVPRIGVALGNVGDLCQCRRHAAHRQGPAQRLRPGARAAGAARIGRLHRRWIRLVFFRRRRRRGGGPQHLPRRQHRRQQPAAFRIARSSARPRQASPSCIRGVRLSYTQVLRTPEFFERDRWDQFGSINVDFQVLSRAAAPSEARAQRPISVPSAAGRSR